MKRGFATSRPAAFHRTSATLSAGWKLRLGPIPFWIPNTNARRQTVRLYGIRHLLTGYDSDWKGEAEIGGLRTRLLLDRAPSDTFSAWATRNP